MQQTKNLSEPICAAVATCRHAAAVCPGNVVQHDAARLSTALSYNLLANSDMVRITVLHATTVASNTGFRLVMVTLPLRANLDQLYQREGTL